MALDNLEVQFQHNQADLATWLPLEHELVYTKMDAPCAHDAFLAAFCEAVKAEFTAKLQAGGYDPAAILARLEAAEAARQPGMTGPPALSVVLDRKVPRAHAAPCCPQRSHAP